MDMMNRVASSTSLLLISFVSYAGAPLWTFSPSSDFPPKVLVPTTGTAMIQYTVSNQTNRFRNLVIAPLPGIQQSAPCFIAPKGTVGDSCTLTLTAIGSALPANGIIGGPRLCQANSNGSPNLNQCYQPNQVSSLQVKLQPALSLSSNNLVLATNGIFTATAGVNQSTCQNVWTGSFCTSKARTLTITNNSQTMTAEGLTYSIIPALPDGTTISPGCSSIAPGDSCVLTITPGSIPSTASPNAPIASILTIQGSNTSPPLTANITVLTYGNNYQGGFVFSIDDTTATQMSVGGKVVAAQDQSMGQNSIWSPTLDVIYGVDEFSTTSLASPDAGSSTPPQPLPGQIACNGATDGVCNTNNIVVFYGTGNYAASICSQPIDSAGNSPCQVGNICYTNWYLPAICEMGFDGFGDGSGCGTAVASTLQNIQENLVHPNNIGNFAINDYWSSTEKGGNPQNAAWLQGFRTNGNSQQGGGRGKNVTSPPDVFFRCIRTFS
ncbi:MAG: DUF1566 domain-containing protein [Legionella sp.]|uniref:DUF1566 domain-containing protein n=1 Tax=Legionella sp. TaxID=459 RepID=UPI0039E3ABD2